jgi:integrase/recombinase XerD
MGGDFNLPSLSSSKIELWADHLRQASYSPASIRRKIVTLRVFCAYWIRKGALSESPFWRVQLSFGRIEQLPRTLTKTEIRALLAQAWRNHSVVEVLHNGSGVREGRPSQVSSRGYRALRNLALVDVLFATGMRVGEASSLDVEDFFVEEGVFRVHGKGGRDRLAFVVDKETIHIQRDT